jgi:ppGpp synthetase/RelA/SpoT-type nucleotidyltranferase
VVLPPNDRPDPARRGSLGGDDGSMNAGEDHGRRARAAYERAEYQAYLGAVRDRTEQLVRDALHGPLRSQDAGVMARVKDPASFEAKAARTAGDASQPRYLRPLSSIHDQVALRVVVLHAGFLNHARDLIQASPSLVVEAHEDKAVEHSANRSFGYRGIHLLIRPVEVDMPRPDHDHCGALDRVEIQVRTQVQHAWAEVEHRLRYKSDHVEEGTSRSLDRAAALLETADDMLFRLVEAAETREPEGSVETSGDAAGAAASAEPTLTVPELLERRFPGARQPTPPTLRWIRNCAQALDLGDAAALDRALADVPLDEIEDVFRAVGHSPRSQVRQLDDALLWLGRERYVAAAENGVEGTSDRYARGRPGILRWRLDRLREAGVLP